MAAMATVTKQDFIGAWVLVSEVEQDADGAETSPRGEHPIGLLVYQESGWMSMQVMRRDRHSGVSLNAFSTLRTEYLGYFGTFVVDREQATVTHFVLGGSYPDYINTQQVRGFQFEDDGATLILTAALDSATTHILTWRRE